MKLEKHNLWALIGIGVFVLAVVLVVILSGSRSSICYQESANVPNQAGTDGSCTLNYTGGYSTSGATIDWAKAYDGNWKTSVSFSSTTYLKSTSLFINYTIPNGALDSSQWEIGIPGGNPDKMYLNLSGAFLQHGNLRLRVEMQTSAPVIPYPTMTYYYAWNYNTNSWTKIYSFDNGGIFNEEGMRWVIKK